MADVKITDLVDESAIEQIKELNAQMQALVATYTTVARDLAKGLQLPVNGLGDLEKLEESLSRTTSRASTATDQLAGAVERQGRAIANTTNTISRQLMEQERVNKTQREAYTEHDRVKKLLEQFHDTYEGQVQRLVRLNQTLDANKKAQKENENMLASGQRTMDQYAQKQAELITAQRALAQEKKTLTQIMTAEEKAAQSQKDSYVHMSQQLELLKKAYKDLDEEGRNSDFGRELEASIQNLDAHLKDTAADMGEFQRNVGNYAIAGQNGVVTTESLIAVMQQEAVTQKNLADQTKILEEAKLMLDRSDTNYQVTLDALNAKLEENRRRLTDVTDIMGMEARTVAEAEAQNKRLSEAMKHIDLNSAGAKGRLQEMRAQIERNNAIIAEATGNNEKFADSMLSIIGVNSSIGSSFSSLETSGSFIDGLHTKVKAFVQTLTGVIANPWILTFLGIAGAGAAFKWWYDYNKGLVEASRLTENFTGKTGKAADSVTAFMQTLADRMAKDYASTISAVNTMVQQFGLSWEEAGRKMQDAITAGADMNGNLLANIERFGPALRDAGVSADEFMAILSETRNGIFNEQGIQNIVKAGTRLRAMTKQTEESLDAVGISAKKMQEDLESGNLSMLDAVRQVAAKLKEIPENSQEAGQIMKNVFGRTAAEGGTLLIQSIADINTNLEKAKEGMDELGKANERQMNAQRELNEMLMSVFKMSGTSFETMLTNSKAFVAEGLTKMVKGLVDVANWFTRIYNASDKVRWGIQSVIMMVKMLCQIAKTSVGATIDIFKALGEMIEGAVNGKWEQVKQGWKNGTEALRKDVGALFDQIAKDAKKAQEEIKEGSLGEIKIGLERDDTKGDGNPVRSGTLGGGREGNTETEKDAQNQLKILRELEAAKVALMSDAHQKELETIRLNHQKRLDAIEGNSKEEIELRKAINEQMEKELAESDQRYIIQITKTNLENRLAVTKEGSREQLETRIAILETQRVKEVAEAEKAGADVTLVETKYMIERQRLEEEFSRKQAEEVMSRYASEQVSRDHSYSEAVNSLKKRYAEELSHIGNNTEKQRELKEKLEEDMTRLDEEYSKKSVESSIEMYETILKDEDLSETDREKIRLELANVRMDLADMEAEYEMQVAERITQKDREETERRIANAQRWLSAASEGLSAINDLVQTIYDTKIERIEEEQERNQEEGDKETERISELVEKQVITEEEGEARKRASAAKTAKKEEELERKKAKLKQKQAIYDKAVNVAKIGMDTAAALMRLWVSPGWPAAIPLQAVVGAMGALQLATVLATPIPKYAKGTESHPGGPAIVGDGGRSELIVYKDAAWLTPDKPTLVDIPKGATVLPDTRDLALPANIPRSKESQTLTAVSTYDDKGMRRAVGELADLIRANTHDRRVLAKVEEYERFKLSRGL